VRTNGSPVTKVVSAHIIHGSVLSSKC
jgi:hypothetical protein